MPSSLVQRIRIRSNALFADSSAANAPSYPAHAVEANPANTIEMAHSTGYRVRRHVLAAIGCDFSLQRRMEGRGGVSQHFRAGRSRRPWFADSGGIGCRRSGPTPARTAHPFEAAGAGRLIGRRLPVDELAMNFRSLRVDTDISRSSSSRRRSSRKCGANTRLCSIASTLVSNSTPMRSLSGTPSFMSKKMFASLSPRLLCRSLDHGKSPTQGGHLKWFAGMWGLVPR